MDIENIDKNFESIVKEIVIDKELANSIIKSWKTLTNSEKKEVVNYVRKHKQNINKLVDFLSDIGEIRKPDISIKNIGEMVGETVSTIASVLVIGTPLFATSMTTLPLGLNLIAGTLSVGLSGILGSLAFNELIESKPFKKLIHGIKTHLGLKKIEEKLSKLGHIIEERAKGVLHKII